MTKKHKQVDDYLLWKDDKLSLYRVKQPFEFQYRMDLPDRRRIFGNTIDEITEIFKTTK